MSAKNAKGPKGPTRNWRSHTGHKKRNARGSAHLPLTPGTTQLCCVVQTPGDGGFPKKPFAPDRAADQKIFLGYATY
jgi:hypothetical protein